MSAAEAKALCPNLQLIDEYPLQDDRALDALGRWLIRFTPVVSLGESTADGMHASVFLDLTGSERLFKSLDRLVDRIRQALSQFGIISRLAVASTPSAAWAFAMTCGCDPKFVNDDSLLAELGFLPVAAMRLEEPICSNLRCLGLDRIGDILVLPREQLPARFGPSLLQRVDQLTGKLAEPLTRLINDPTIAARMEFDAPIEDLEDIWQIFNKLLGLLIADLISRNLGVRQLKLILKPDRGWGLPTIVRTIAISKPHRERAALFNLIRGEIERIDLDRGFIRFQLDIVQHERICEAQAGLFDQRSLDQERELDHLIERLRARLGDKSVIQPQLVESHVPERAWTSKIDVPLAKTATPQQRPLTLFSTPYEILVVSEPLDRHIGQPRQFTWDGRVYRLVHSVGPERIAGEWWRGHRHTRDYFDAEDEMGQRFWLFRVMHVQTDGEEYARWFLHGRFD